MNEDKFMRTDPPPQRDPVSPPPEFRSAEATPGAVSQEVGKMTSEIKGGADQVLESAKDAGSQFVREQKEKLAATLEEYTAAIETACEKLEGGAGSKLASPAHSAATQLQRAAGYLRSHEPAEFIRDFGNLARRRPEWVFGTLFVAGLASARFLKASSRDRDRMRRSTGQRPYPRESQSELSRPEPLPGLAPLGPAPALETTNPLSSNEW
jgi:hypothetical protein